MTRVHHPNNKADRLSAEKKKELLRDAKAGRDKAGHVWKKLTREHLKYQETQDELILANSGSL